LDKSSRHGPKGRGGLYLIFPETTAIGLHFCRWMYESIFIQFCAVVTKRCIFSALECVLALQCRSGSSEVDDLGTNRNDVCDFLLVGRCKYGSILHHFSDTAIYWLKLPIFLPLSLTAPWLPMFPLEFWGEFNREETSVMGLSYREERMILAW